MRNSQLLLFSHPGLEYGGSSRSGRRKIQRPFDRKRPLHLVFRSNKARGERSFLHRRHKGEIREILRDLGRRYGVRVQAYENIGHHLHLVARIPGRRELRAFLRVFAQRVMFQVTGARKGAPQGRFFDGVAYSKVMTVGEERASLSDVLGAAALEAYGVGREEVLAWRTAARTGPP